GHSVWVRSRFPRSCYVQPSFGSFFGRPRSYRTPSCRSPHPL
ncbi:MAG: hypothetical protein AVDCRST_MAG55-99, partial [uncultured Rubrobacteraceae bacterium]